MRVSRNPPNRAEVNKEFILENATQFSLIRISLRSQRYVRISLNLEMNSRAFIRSGVNAPFQLSGLVLEFC